MNCSFPAFLVVLGMDFSLFECLSPGLEGRNLSLPLHIHTFFVLACLGWLLFSSSSGMSWIWVGSSVKLGLWNWVEENRKAKVANWKKNTNKKL